MAAVLFSLLVIGVFGSAREVTVRGEHGAFRLEARFQERDMAAGGSGALARGFHLVYDPTKLHHTFEHLYLKSIFGNRAFELSTDGIEVRGTRRFVDHAQGIDADFLELHVLDPRLLKGYYGFGVEVDGEGLPFADAKVILLEGHLTGVQSALHNLVVGQAKYYLRPILNCQRTLSAQTALEVATD